MRPSSFSSKCSSMRATILAARLSERAEACTSSSASDNAPSLSVSTFANRCAPYASVSAIEICPSPFASTVAKSGRSCACALVAARPKPATIAAINTGVFMSYPFNQSRLSPELLIKRPTTKLPSPFCTLFCVHLRHAVPCRMMHLSILAQNAHEVLVWLPMKGTQDDRCDPTCRNGRTPDKACHVARLSAEMPKLW